MPNHECDWAKTRDPKQPDYAETWTCSCGRVYVRVSYPLRAVTARR